jgi:hypothetical protein
MKRFLLLLLCISGLSHYANAQCTPNILYTDSVFGVWPDTTTNFPPVEINDAYFTQLDMILPSNTSDVPGLPVQVSAPIDSGSVLSVIGLPAGMDYACGSHTPSPCTYLPDSLGCAALSGTAPAEAGVYDIEITVRAYVFFLGSTIEYDLTFDGYRIVVTDSTAVGLSDDVEVRAVLQQNRPNPFDRFTDIEFELMNAGPATFKVVNMLGDEVFNTEIQGRSGVNTYRFEPDGLNEGIYLYSIITEQGHVTKRMVYSN